MQNVTTADLEAKLASLKLTYTGYEQDKMKANDALASGNSFRAQRMIQKLGKKQSVYEGDRSHPQLLALDSLVLTYPGWLGDVSEVEQTHFSFDGKIFWDKLQGLKNKQRIYLGDRSNPNLVKLDSLRLSYPGWESDLKAAEDAHNEGNEWRFKRLHQKMEKRQKTHEGDRSHPRMKALDALVLQLEQKPYPGWQTDAREAENTHFEFEGKVFWDKLDGMKNKQRVFIGDRTHPDLVKLDSLRLTYHGWEQDVKEAEQSLNDGSSKWRFRRLFCKLEKKQKAHEGDRSHPCLQALDAMALVLQYPGCELDVHDAENTYFEFGDKLFLNKLEGMETKQKKYAGCKSKPGKPSMRKTAPGRSSLATKLSRKVTVANGFRRKVVQFQRSPTRS